MSSKQIGRNVEVYMDNMLAKSREVNSHLDNLQEALNTLKRYQMKLNPVRCIFGLKKGLKQT